jgi:ubiquinone/menaquinone biosynthesis C-methylase UbiE
MKFLPEQIAEFWESDPCGSSFIKSKSTWRDFFIEYDNFKYSVEPHIPHELSKIDFNNKKVLEIGLGQGAEAQTIIEGGGIYNGIDLTMESIKRVKTRFDIFDLPYESLQIMNAEQLEFESNLFDVVFSHGVIHHSPRIREIIYEIYRVLKPGGLAVIMVYHRNSINYQISIKVIRRLGIFLLFFPGMVSLVSKVTHEDKERLEKHRTNLRTYGIDYLKMSNFIHKSTDGPDNVFSSVFSEKEIRMLFSRFASIEIKPHHLNERHLPILKSILSKKIKEKIANRYGWHLWIKATK